MVRYHVTRDNERVNTHDTLNHNKYHIKKNEIINNNLIIENI